MNFSGPPSLRQNWEDRIEVIVSAGTRCVGEVCQLSVQGPPPLYCPFGLFRQGAFEHFRWYLLAQRLDGPFSVVEAEVVVGPGLGLPPVWVGLQIDLFVLDCPPEPFDEYVVAVASLPVHANSDPLLLQESGEGLTGALAPLTGVEDLRFPLPSAFFSASAQKSASKVLESRQATTHRLYQSMMATRYRDPLAMGI